MGQLDGQVAIVTGSGRGGLGAHSTLALAREGARLCVSDIGSRAEDLQHTRNMLEEDGHECLSVECDVTDAADVDRLIQEAMEQFGRVDILANHAGVMLRKDSLDTTVEEWNRVLAINLTGTWLQNNAAARAMLQGGRGGRIINTSTLYTNIVGPIPEPAYYASKAGVANLTRGLAAEWGTHGITVNCLAPGVFYPTNMTAPLKDQPERLRWMEERTMLGRLGDPDRDLCGVVAFLASDAARYITGQVLFVDGGWTAW
ncbi:MAG: SDR family oxidoreductase [Actinomycetota bacterium]